MAMAASRSVWAIACADVALTPVRSCALVALPPPRASTLQSVDDLGHSLELLDVELRERVGLIVAAARRDGFNEVDKVDGETGRNQRQGIDTDVDLTALDLSDVLVLIANEFGELLLRHATKQSKLFHPSANLPSDLRL